MDHININILDINGFKSLHTIKNMLNFQDCSIKYS